jgi:hypothetical protein
MRPGIVLALFLAFGCAYGRSGPIACPLPSAATFPSIPRKTVTPVALVSHGPIEEMSGIVKSARYPDTYWVHNDSGDTARLFAIRADGQVIVPGFLQSAYSVGPVQTAEKPFYPGIRIDGATNYDWEDIARDGDTLYISDLGNNGNARRDLAVYTVTEPNPAAVEGAHFVQRLPIVYPDQSAYPDPTSWHFDCEAIFVYKKRLHLLTKHRVPGRIGTPEAGTNLYRLDTQHTDRPNVVKKLDSVADLGGWITAADLSPDGKTLAVLCEAPVASVWLFSLGKTGDRLLSGAARRLILEGAKQCEGICFDSDNELIVTNEDRDLFRLRTADFAVVSR